MAFVQQKRVEKSIVQKKGCSIQKTVSEITVNYGVAL